MKKIVLVSILLNLFVFKGKTQNPNVFLYENKTNISKDSILKIGRLNISNTSFKIESFTYVITGSKIGGEPDPTYGTNKGSVFCDHLLNEIKKYQDNKSSLLITDVVVHNSKNTSQNRKKLNQQLRINF